MSNVIDFETFEFDAQATTGGTNDGIANGEIVKCIILDFGYPSSYLASLKEENEKAKKDAEDMGLDFEEKKPSFKDGGIMAKVAVLERLDTHEKVFRIGDNDEYVEPSYTCYTQISMVPPHVVFTKKWSSFGKGLINLKADGSLYIGNIIPSAFEAQDFATKVVIEDKEQERLASWKSLIDSYTQMTELQAHQWLLKALAQRFLLSHKGEKGFALLKPQTGVVFQARVRRKEGSRLFDLERFQWNGDRKQYDIFGSTSAYIDEESVDIASQIIGVRESNRLKRETAKAVKQEKEKVLDEVPF